MPSTSRSAVALAALATLVSTGLVSTASPASGQAPAPTVRRVLGGIGAGDGGPLSQARVFPGAIAGSPDGSLVFYDSGLLRVVDGSTKIIKTVAGGGSAYPATGVLATSVDLTRREVLGVALSSTGEVSFSSNSQVFTVRPDGTLVVRAGGDRFAYKPDGTLLVVGPSFGTAPVRLDSYAPGSSTRVLVAGGVDGTSLDDGVAASTAQLPGLFDVAVDPATGDIYTTDDQRVRKVSASDQTISTIAGTLTSGPFAQPAEGAPTTTQIAPTYLSLAPGGDLEFLNGRNTGSLQLTGVTPGGTLHRLAGGTACGFASFVSRTSDLLVPCGGLRSVARTAGATLPGDLVALRSGHSTDDVPVGTAWADSYDSIARLTGGELALASGGDLLLVKGSAITTHHEDGFHVALVAAAPGGQVVIFESPATGFSSGLVRIVSADGLTATTLAGGGSGDPTGATQPATSADLRYISSLVVGADGGIFLADARHAYEVTPTGDLVHVSGFTADDLDAVGPLALDPRDGSLVINGPKGVYRRDSSTGAFTRISRWYDAGSFAVAPDGSLLFGSYAWYGGSGSVARVWPDGSSARIAGLGQSEHSPDGLDPLLTNLNPRAMALDTDGTLLLADNTAYPLNGGEVRDLDLVSPERPSAPTTGTVTGDDGILTVNAPAPPDGTAWEVQVRADGSTPLTALDSDGLNVTTNADGSIQASTRKLNGVPLVAGRTYAVRLNLRSLTNQSRGPGEVLPVTLKPDTTPPAPATAFAVSPAPTTADYLYVLPTDADLDHVEVRFAPGTVPPATPTDGDFGGQSFPSQHTQYGRGSVSISPAQPYAFAAFAVDFQGNWARTTALLAAPSVVSQPTSTFFLYAGPSPNGSGTQIVSTGGNDSVPALRYALGSTAPDLPDAGTALDGSYGYWTQPALAAGTTYSVSAFSFVPGDFTKVTRISKTFTAGTTYQVVQPVTGLTAASGSGTATLTWASVNPAGTTNVLTSSTGQTTYPTGTSYALTKLTPGTDYSYTFRSYYGLYSTGTQGISLHGTRLAMAAPGILTANKPVTFRATLLHGSTPVLGRTVTLYVSGPKGTMVPAVSAKTGAGGVALLTYKPTNITLVQARFLGGGTDLGSVATQYFTQVASAVSLKASSLSGKAGRAVTLSATVAPTTVRFRLTFQQLVGRTWKTVGYATMNTKGVAALGVHPPRGRTSYRVLVPSGRYNSAATSGTLTVSGS